MRTRLQLKTSLKPQPQSPQSYDTPPEIVPFLYSDEVNYYYAPFLPVVSLHLRFPTPDPLYISNPHPAQEFRCYAMKNL